MRDWRPHSGSYFEINFSDLQVSTTEGREMVHVVLNTFTVACNVGNDNRRKIVNRYQDGQRYHIPDKAVQRHTHTILGG